MNLLNRLKLPAVMGMLLAVGFISSCEQDLTTIGDGVIGGEPFITNKETFSVFAFNKKIEAVQTNQLPIYQLGVFNDPVYGRTEASITSQVQLPANNPTFGNLSAEREIEEAFSENETIDSVFIYIPYQNNQTDSDNDGVVDSLDDMPFDATNDSDGDGVPNNQEDANNTNPLVRDTDGDGIEDGEDDSTSGDRFPRRFRLDSIVGDRMQPFNLKVERSTFFLRDLDPNSNFQDSQEYFSSQQFSPTFTDEVFFDGETAVSDEQILFVVQEDDPDTDDNEIGTISMTLDPGIRVPLNDVGRAFFQENILDREGSSELLSDTNFKNFFRGVHISVTPSMEELLFLLDIRNAQIQVFYHFSEMEDDNIVEDQASLNISLITGDATTGILGNAVNTFINEDYPAEITNAIDTGENASRIYLKGGAGSFAEIELFDEDSELASNIISDIRANNWIINEANLVFNIDTDAVPATAIEPPRLYLFNAETNAPLYNIATENSVADTPLGVFLNYDGILQESNDRGVRYSVKITEYINDIIVRDSTNATLGLAITPDIRIVGANNTMLSGGIERDIPAAGVLSPLGTVLFGSNLPEGDSNRLELEIFYTEAN